MRCFALPLDLAHFLNSSLENQRTRYVVQSPLSPCGNGTLGLVSDTQLVYATTSYQISRIINRKRKRAKKSTVSTFEA